MIESAVSAGRAGLDTATKRIETSAQAVASVNTGNSRKVEIQQAVDSLGRPQSAKNQAPKSQDVDLAREAVEQTKALVSGQAALRALEAEFSVKGALLDMKV